MYESFYGLTSRPFQLNPDPAFYFRSKQHSRATAYLDYGLHQSQGFIVITGEVGAGKTTIVRNMLAKLDPDKVVAAQLVSTQLDAEDTLRLVGAAFGVRVKDVSKADLLMTLEAFFTMAATEGKRCLLIVDEAQNLSHRAVEELRMLSNFQYDNVSLVQTFLIGQPEFRAILQSPQMLQLRQRVIATCHISPMDRQETQGYIEHRLKCAGYVGEPMFDEGGYDAIYAATGGVPRRINSLCDRILLFGYLSGKTAFTAEHVQEVQRELEDETQIRATGLPVPEGDGKVAGGNANMTLGLGETVFDIDPRVVNEASALIVSMGADQLGERLLRLERGMLRLERINSAMLTLLQQLLQAARGGREGEQTNSGLDG